MYFFIKYLQKKITQIAVNTWDQLLVLSQQITIFLFFFIVFYRIRKLRELAWQTCFRFPLEQNQIKIVGCEVPECVKVTCTYDKFHSSDNTLFVDWSVCCISFVDCLIYLKLVGEANELNSANCLLFNINKLYS